MRLRLILSGCLVVSTVAACATGNARSAELQVFAASSLEQVLSGWEPEIEEEIGVQVAMSFASSSVVARQVAEGAPADVLITADRHSMRIAADNGAVGERTIVARNRLALVVRAGNPLRIDSIRDLSRRDLKAVLCDPEVPCGRLAAALLDEVDVSVRPDSLEENVSAAVGKVAFGEADVTIAYASDGAVPRRDTEVVPLAEAADRGLEAVYPAAVVTRSRQRAAAAAFIDLLASPAGTAVFVRSGFLAP